MTANRQAACAAAFGLAMALWLGWGGWGREWLAEHRGKERIEAAKAAEDAQMRKIAAEFNENNRQWEEEREAATPPATWQPVDVNAILYSRPAVEERIVYVERESPPTNYQNTSGDFHVRQDFGQPQPAPQYRPTYKRTATVNRNQSSSDDQFWRDQQQAETNRRFQEMEHQRWLDKVEAEDRERSRRFQEQMQRR